jgi:ABC-type transport system involved in multi-copper enzyme maturation permease subunit
MTEWVVPAQGVASSPRSATFGRIVGGIVAIGVKELRGRMRGRRAFVILTIYLSLLAVFALMVERIIEANVSSGFGGFGGSAAFASASIGQGIFAATLMLMTLQVAFLAPSSTSGAISLEREKQTLELLVTTPISSFAIVIGKLLSALIYLFLLIAASIPLMAAVFVFGGVGPEDMIKGYIVLIVTAIGLGSFGLLCSSLVKRTTAATAITIFGVLAITIGTIFVLGFWQAVSGFDQNGNRKPGPFGIRSPAPLAWVNPFIAEADVLCGTESSFGGGWCGLVNGLVPTNEGVIFTNDPSQPFPMPMPAPAMPEKGFVPNVGAGVVVGDTIVDSNGAVIGRIGPDGGPVDDVAVDPNQQPFGVRRDGLWTRSVATWLVLSAIFVILSIQAVSPTRRWRLRRPRRALKVPAA